MLYSANEWTLSFGSHLGRESWSTGKVCTALVVRSVPIIPKVDLRIQCAALLLDAKEKEISTPKRFVCLVQKGKDPTGRIPNNKRLSLG